MRAAFFGSPAFAVPCLDALATVAEVVLVVSQPDKPRGRGLKLQPPAVKARALELGLPVHQPRKVRDGSLAARLQELELDVAVVVAYGRILPRAVLDAPRRGCVNVHGSLLPRWRGAAPIQYALMHGDARTGVTLMRMDEGMDTGPMIAARETAIDPDEDTPALGARLATLGAALLRDALPAYVAGERDATPQPREGVTHAALLTKEDGRLDLRQPAATCHDRVRALRPWPGTFLERAGQRLKVHRSARRDAAGAPGEVLAIGDDSLIVACGEGAIALEEVQEPGRRRVSGAELARAGRIAPGERFDLPGAASPS
ncbi:MAG: methionyl-tRNA formyltransferase [Myxococcota bacterium]